MTTIRIQREDFDVGAETAALTRGPHRYRRGRDLHRHLPRRRGGSAIAAMTLEHYPGMAEAEIARHVEEAEARWPLIGVTVIHRYGRHGAGRQYRAGRRPPSSHRERAFAAAEFLMDYLKTRAPFWKQEERAGGNAWVDAKEADDAAAERWRSRRTPRRRRVESRSAA